MLAWVRFVEEKAEKQKSPAANKTNKVVLEGKKREVGIDQSPASTWGEQNAAWAAIRPAPPSTQ